MVSFVAVMFLTGLILGLAKPKFILVQTQNKKDRIDMTKLFLYSIMAGVMMAIVVLLFIPRKVSIVTSIPMTAKPVKSKLNMFV